MLGWENGVGGGARGMDSPSRGKNRDFMQDRRGREVRRRRGGRMVVAYGWGEGRRETRPERKGRRM